MRWHLAIFLIAVLVGAATAQGFFESLRSAFSLRPRRQSRPQFRPQQSFQPQAQQQQPVQPQFNRPSASTRFKPSSQNFQASQGFNNQVNTNQNVNNGFRFNGQSNQNVNNGFRFNGQSNQNVNNGVRLNSQTGNQGFINQGNRGQSFVNSKNKFINRPRNNNYRRCASKEVATYCPPSEPNHYDATTGKWYLLTWNITCPSNRRDCDCTKFTGDQAMEYCNNLPKGRALSLDTPHKKQHFRDVSAQWAQRYYWTGARIQYPDNYLIWPNGKNETWVRGQGEWSPTGLTGDPQPDNRNEAKDGCEPEFCVGVLNNFYRDGIVWHDVACHHKKPTICEFD